MSIQWKVFLICLAGFVCLASICLGIYFVIVSSSEQNPWPGKKVNVLQTLCVLALIGGGILVCYVGYTMMFNVGTAIYHGKTQKSGTQSTVTDPPVDSTSDSTSAEE